MSIAKRLGLIVLIFIFGEAALTKLLGNGVPPWFLKQFTGSLLDLGGSSLSLAFWSIAVLELLTTLILIASFFKHRLLKPALLLAQFTFFALMIGLRLTHKYDEAFQTFAYSFIVYFFANFEKEAS